MIAAIDASRLAARDDRAVGAPTQVQDQKFSAILNTASRRDSSQALARLERSQSAAEPQARSIYAERPRATPPEARETPRQDQARSTPPGGVSTKAAERAANAGSPVDKTPDGGGDGVAESVTASQQDKDQALTGAEAPVPAGDQLAGTAAQPGIVLTFRDIIAQSNASARQRSINVQLGAAAWRMTPHGASELELARQLGALPPPDYAQALGSTTALDGRNAFRTSAQLGAGDLQSDPVLVIDALAMVELSKQAQAARAAAAKPEAAAAPEGSAMARNGFLAQIGGSTATAEPGAAAITAAASEPVAEKLLVPGKEPRPKPPEGATTALPAALGAPTGAQTMERPQSLSSDTSPPDTRLLDKVVQEARWLIRNNRQEVTLRLEPEHLGSLKLHVSHKDGALHVEMTVDNAAAKHLLDANLGQLRERFVQENLAQGNLLQVDVRQGGNPEFARQFGRQGTEPGAPTAGIRAPVSVEESAAIAPRAVWSDSNLSIYA